MDNEALLALYLEKLRQISLEKLEENDITVLEALKEAIIFSEGELSGY